MSSITIMERYFIGFSCFLLTGTIPVKCDNKSDLINDYKFLKRINKGHFKSIPDAYSVAHNSFDEEELLDMVHTMGRRIRCNHLFYMVAHVRLCDPLLHSQPDVLQQQSMLNSFHEWSKDMLVTFYNNPRLRHLADVFWVFFLYTYRVDAHLASENRDETRKVILSSHEYTEDILLNEMDKCIDMLDWNGTVKPVYDSYIRDTLSDGNNVSKLLQNFNGASVMLKSNVSKLLQNFNSASVMLKSNVSNGMELKHTEFFDLKKLYLTNLIGNAQVMDTLTSKFGLIYNVNELKEFFKSKFDTINDPKSSLPEHIKALYVVQWNFVNMLVLMMLRIRLEHLKGLRILSPDNRFDENLKMYNRFNEFLDFLKVNDTAGLRLYNEMFNSSRKDLYSFGEINTVLTNESVDENIRSSEFLIKEIRHSDDDVKVKISRSVDLSVEKVQNIASDNGLHLYTENTKNLAEISNYYAEVFMKYVTKILSGIDLQVIYSFLSAKHFIAKHSFSENYIFEFKFMQMNDNP